jgi:hypothetical protein
MNPKEQSLCYPGSHHPSILFFLFLFFFVALMFEIRTFTLSHSTALFCEEVSQDRISQTIFLGWLQTAVLLISASRVARIAGVSHRHLTPAFS